MTLEIIQELNIQEVLDRAEDAGVVSIGNFIETLNHVAVKVHRKCLLDTANIMVIHPDVKILKHFPKDYNDNMSEYELRKLKTQFKHTHIKNGYRCGRFRQRYLVIACLDLPKDKILLGRISSGVKAVDETINGIPSIDFTFSSSREFLIGNISYAHTLRLEE